MSLFACFPEVSNLERSNTSVPYELRFAVSVGSKFEVGIIAQDRCRESIVWYIRTHSIASENGCTCVFGQPPDRRILWDSCHLLLSGKVSSGRKDKAIRI